MGNCGVVEADIAGGGGIFCLVNILSFEIPFGIIFAWLALSLFLILSGRQFVEEINDHVCSFHLDDEVDKFWWLFDGERKNCFDWKFVNTVSGSKKLAAAASEFVETLLDQFC